MLSQVLYKNKSIKKFGFYFSGSLEGKPMEATDGEIGKYEDVLFYDKRGHIAYLVIGYKVMSKKGSEIGEVAVLVLDTTFWSLPYLRVRESAILRPRDLIVPWEYIEAFSMASENIQTSLDEAILKNAPEAPGEEEFSDSELEASIRNYYRLS